MIYQLQWKYKSATYWGSVKENKNLEALEKLQKVYEKKFPKMLFRIVEIR